MFRRRFFTRIMLTLAVFSSLLWSLPLLADDEESHPVAGGGSAYEVWAIDQSDTTADGGGTLYIYQGAALNGRHAAKATPEVIDLGGSARTLCLNQTGSAPKRPHMFSFNATHSHVVLAFVASGHVLFMDAATRTPLTCLDAGVQAHAATPAPDQRYVVVANQNGKLLQRIKTDYTTNTFSLEEAATINLETCTTPSGAACQDPTLRPDNAPICPIIDRASRLTFVTLRGGGLFVVDTTATPMRIVAEYDQATVHPNGCGGVETNGKLYINAGGGTPANPLESDLYAFALNAFAATPNAPNTPAPHIIFSQDEQAFVDSHGAVLTKGERYLWVADRAANRIVIVDTAKDAIVQQIDLVGKLSPDVAPDLLAISPEGHRVFMTLRGPKPLTGNAPDVNNAVGSTPGVGILRVMSNGRWGMLQAIAPISHIVDGVEVADPHGIAVRRK